MGKNTLCLLGEAEKGDFCTPIRCRTLVHLIDYLGNPPKESQGIFYAIQAILYKRDVLFFRVKEEGYSQEDYLLSVQWLQASDMLEQLVGLGMPGVGDKVIINATQSLCQTHKIPLILTGRDLYDYLTSSGKIVS